jgi:hypothetical protein
MVYEVQYRGIYGIIRLNMSTRAKIRFVEREEGVTFSEHPGVDKTQIEIYKHYDGYPSGLGVNLAKFLDEFTVVDGLGQDNYKIANGLGCLAAQYVEAFKQVPGDIYLQKPNDSMDDCDYCYYVWVTEDKSIWISIFDYDDCIFVGKPDKLQTKYEE